MARIYVSGHNDEALDAPASPFETQSVSGCVTTQSVGTMGCVSGFRG